LQYNIPIGSIVNTFSVLVQHCYTFFLIFGIVIANIYIGYGYANWSTNTNILRISRKAKYKRQLNAENHTIFSKATATTGLCFT